MMGDICVRWGIIGAGRISNDFVTAINLLPDSHNKVVAVAARKLSDAEEFIQRLNLTDAKAYGDYASLASDSNIDVVYVGTIHPVHFKCVQQMMDAGKNVLCEKPLGMNSKEVNAMVEKAKEKNVFLAEAFWSRYFPAYEQLHSELASKSIGDVVFVQVNFGFNNQHRMQEKNRVFEKSMGGGALLDIGCYAVQFAQFIFREKPTTIVASGLLHTNGVDISETVTLYYSGNRMAQFNTSFLAGLDQTATVYGTKGLIKMPYFWCPSSLITPSKTWDFPLPELKLSTEFQRSQGFAYEAHQVATLIENGKKESPWITLKESVEIANIMDEIRRQIGVAYDADE